MHSVVWAGGRRKSVWRSKGLGLNVYGLEEGMARRLPARCGPNSYQGRDGGCGDCG